eukprot:4702760-Prymnesium_polylepis.1
MSTTVVSAFTPACGCFDGRELRVDMRVRVRPGQRGVVTHARVSSDTLVTRQVSKTKSNSSAAPAARRAQFHPRSRVYRHTAPSGVGADRLHDSSAPVLTCTQLVHAYWLLR